MKPKFYYSLYEFQATDQAVMLSLTKGQVVRIIPETNSTLGTGGAASAGLNDWCYVEDRYANRGYVPRQFLKLYDLGSLQLKIKKQALEIKEYIQSILIKAVSFLFDEISNKSIFILNENCQ